MAISDKIKEHRKKLGLTQRELAERLNVSVQAVSKWETGGGIPDVSALTPLARELHITTDELLDFRDRRQELEKLWQETLKTYGDSSKELYECTCEALKEFPEDETFLYRRACLGRFLYEDMDANDTDRPAWFRKHHAQLSSVMRLHPEWDWPISEMVYLLVAADRKNEAVTYAKRAEGEKRESLLLHCLEGEDLRHLRQTRIEKRFRDLLKELRCGDLALLDMAERLIQTVIPDGNYLSYYSGFLVRLSIQRAEILAAEQEYDNALASLERAFEYAQRADTAPDDRYTCPLFDTLSYPPYPVPAEDKAPSHVEQFIGVLEYNGNLTPLKSRKEYRHFLAKAKACAGSPRMTVAEFESYLQKGLGRAILLLRHEPDKTPFREAVWNHAIHDPRYDHQCNAPRGSYIKNLFDCFPDGDAMLTDLFRYYGEGKGDHEDRRYHMENLDELWRDQSKPAAVALDGLYRVLLHELLTLPNPLTNGCDMERDDYFLAAEYRYRWNPDTLRDLVHDGVTLLQNGNRCDITDFTDFFDHQIKVSKTEEFAAILTALEKEDPSCKDILDNYRRESAELPKRRGPSKEDTIPRPTTWREAIDFAIKSGKPRLPIKPSLWENLSAEDGAEIAKMAEEEPNPLRRTVLLSQLRRYGADLLRRYPRDPSPLIAELEQNAHVTFPYSSETLLLWELSRLVANIRHPAVREFALRLLPSYAEKTDSIVFSHAIKAWITNYLPDDADALTEFVTSITDVDVLHEIGMDLTCPQPDPLIPETVLLYLYENTPCSSCRNRVFLYLMVRYEVLTDLPEPLASIREEAKLDCDYGTAMIARAQSIREGEV